MPAKVTQPSPCPGIKGGHTGGGEVAQLPAHHREAVLQGGGGDQQIGAVVAQGGRELTPASSTPELPCPVAPGGKDTPNSS